MRDKKKAVFNLIFLLVVFGLTIYGVFHEKIWTVCYWQFKEHSGNG